MNGVKPSAASPEAARTATARPCPSGSSARERLLEDVQVGVFAEIGGHADDLGMLLRGCHERMAEGRRRGALAFAGDEAIIADVVSFGLRRLAGRAGHAGLAASSASSARSHSWASTRMKWFFSRASRKGTPLPISVCRR